MAGTVKYDPEHHNHWVWWLCVKGSTDQEIADAFGISVRTVNRWKEKHMSFRKKMDEGKAGADAKVIASLYKRAVGYEYEETESLLEMDGNGNQKPLRVKKVKKHIAPDTMAAMYWLNNRTRTSGEWSQRQDVNFNISEGSKDVVIYLPAKETDEDD